MELIKEGEYWDKGRAALFQSLDLEIANAEVKLEALRREPLPAGFKAQNVALQNIRKAKERLEFWQELRDHANLVSNPVYLAAA